MQACGLKIGLRKFFRLREGNLQIGHAGDFQLAGLHTVIRHMAAMLAVITEDMEVIPCNIDPLHVRRRTEAEHHAADLAHAESRLLGDDLQHPRIRLVLAEHRTGIDRLELARKTHGPEQVGIVDQLIDEFLELFLAHGPVNRNRFFRFKIGNTGEGGLHVRRGAGGNPFGAELTDLAFSHDHLAIQGIKRPQTEITMLDQLTQRHFTVIDGIQQRSHRGCLEKTVWLYT